MKCNVGDKVRIKSIDWYNENKDEFGVVHIENGEYLFFESDTIWCSKVITIVDVCLDEYYTIAEDFGKHRWTDEMFEGLAEEKEIIPKFKVGDMICRAGGLSNGCLVMSVSDEYYGLQMGEGNVGVLPVKDQDEWVLLSAGDKKIEEIVEEETKPLTYEETVEIIEAMQGIGDSWECPQGYQFVDENGNVINATKIVLEKKKPKYPQSYEECCEIVKVDKNHTLEGEIIRKNNYKIALLESFQKLLICRDAYWEIAGEEMELGDMWEPDWSDDCRKFSIVVEGNEILADVCLWRNRILVFPTEEMRDMFLKVFRKDIEECKEFL